MDPAQTQKYYQQLARSLEYEEGLDVGDGLDHIYYAPVTSECSEKRLGIKLKPHPDKVSEAAALSSVRSPNLKYSLCLPKEILLNGISALQVQAVHLACARHETYLPTGQRAGFYLGDGPGVGKGRQIAALVTEDILRKRGNERAMWFSASADLAVDAMRDFRDIGAYKYDPIRIHDLRKVGKLRAGEKLEDVKGLDKGILFCIYSLLISQSTSVKTIQDQQKANPWLLKDPKITDVHASRDHAEAAWGKLEFASGSRLDKIVEWCGGASFDGALVFDECHKAKNCVANNHGEQNITATGATEASNLGYMQRLGLWGPGTSFRSKAEFISLVQEQGISVMELVAMELKQSGYFLARTLSYEGVTYEQLPVQISPEYRELYNKSCAVWVEMWGGHLRFFRQLLTACKVEQIETFSKKTLAEGHCIVIGLQSTGEARTEAMVRAMEVGNDESFAFGSFADPAGLIMTTVIEQHCRKAPNYNWLLDRAKSLKLPTNPLDDLIDRLGGVDKVAELTGRRKRMVRDPDAGTFHYKARAQDMPLDKVNIAKKDRFQRGEKLVAIISDAASTGISLQADLSVPNMRLRVHITAELAWSADKAVQQLGRTHRSNQKQPPRYVILFTDVAGEHRFAGAVAKRLEQLGALTHGDRHAACQDALASFNIDDKYGQAALADMYRTMLRRQTAMMPGYAVPAWMEELTRHLPPEQQEIERARFFEAFLPVACQMLRDVDVITSDQKYMGRETEYRSANNHLPDTEKVPTASFNKLMNRLLGVKIEYQRKIFDYFTALQEKHIRQAKREHKFEPPGILHFSNEITPVRHSILMESTCTIACGNTFLYFLYEYKMDRGIAYEQALELLKAELAQNDETRSGFYSMTHRGNGNRHFVLALECNKDGRRVTKADRGKRGSFMRLIRPNNGFAAGNMGYMEFKGKYSRIKDDKQESAWMEKLWREEHRKDPGKTRFVDVYLVTGSILPALQPILRRFKTLYVQRGRKVHLKVARVKASNGDERVGIMLDDKLLPEVLDAIDKATIRLQEERDEAMTGLPQSAPLVAPPASQSHALQEISNVAPSVHPADTDWLEEASEKKERRKGATGGTRRRYSKHAAELADQKRNNAAVQVQLTAEDEEQLAQCACWESIELPPIKESELKREVETKAGPEEKAPRAVRAKAARQEFASAGETSSDSEPGSDGEGSDGEDHSKRRRKAAAAESSLSEERGSDGDNSDEESDVEEPAAAPESAKSGKQLPTAADVAAHVIKQLRKSSDRSASRTAAASGSAAPSSDEDDAAEDANSDGSAGVVSESEGAAKADKAGGSDASSKEEDKALPKQRRGRKAPEQEKGRRKKPGRKAADAGGSSEEDADKVFTNSDISEGWVVRCTCGVTKDDGRDMIECETCKTWQHVKCVLGKSRAKALPPGQEFTCTFCQAADADVPHSRPTQAAEDDKEEMATQHGDAVDHGKGAGAALEDSPSKQEARVSTPLKRNKAADGVKEEQEAKKGKMAKLAKKAARRAALAARDKSATKRISSARGSPDADASGPVKTVTPVKRRRAKTGAAARPEDGSDKDESRAAPDADLLLDGTSDEDGSQAVALGSQGKRLRVRALLSSSEEESAGAAVQRPHTSAAERQPAQDTAALGELQEKCSRLQAELEAKQKAQKAMVASAAAEAQQKAEAAAAERIEAAVAERVNSWLMESMRKARDLGRQKAVEEWSKRLEKERAENAAALAAARAALELAAWHVEKEELLSAQQELAAANLALEAKLAAAVAKPANPRAESQMRSRLEEALAEKEQLAVALEEAEEAAAELARQRASLADAEQQLALEKARAAAAQAAAEAEKQRLAAELERRNSARRPERARSSWRKLAALTTEMQSLRSRAALVAGDSEEECGAGTPARRGSAGGPGPASAPASLQKSAIKVAPGLGSKRVSWDPSVWAANNEETVAETPAGKKQKAVLQTASSMQQPETPAAHDKQSQQESSIDQEALLNWMRSQSKAVSFDDVAAGLGLVGGKAALLRTTMDALLSDFEIYETGVCTGQYQIL
ncbi:g9049 [Coccomyxa elongata]